MKKKIINPAGEWSYWSEEKKSALKSASSNNQVGMKLAHENTMFKVWTIHLPANESLPFHKHDKRYFWTALTPGKSRSFYNDGSVMETNYEAGDTVYFETLNKDNYFIHNLENTGDTTLIFNTVEFISNLV